MSLNFDPVIADLNRHLDKEDRLMRQQEELDNLAAEILRQTGITSDDVYEAGDRLQRSDKDILRMSIVQLLRIKDYIGAGRALAALVEECALDRAESAAIEHLCAEAWDAWDGA